MGMARQNQAIIQQMMQQLGLNNPQALMQYMQRQRDVDPQRGSTPNVGPGGAPPGGFSPGNFLPGGAPQADPGSAMMQRLMALRRGIPQPQQGQPMPMQQGNPMAAMGGPAGGGMSIQQLLPLLQMFAPGLRGMGGLGGMQR
jgi:hypothetical protein